MLFKKNIQTGQTGENIAEEYLKKLKYKIIERNWHYSKASEIDIIALDNKTLVFIEVKTRSDITKGHPFEAITNSKLEKIKKGIQAYLQLTNIKFNDYRIDGIAIVGLNNPTIEHIKNIGQF